jgi:hypothetical protein
VAVVSSLRGANPFQTYFVAIDSAKGTLTRYVHHRGTWTAKHLRTAAVDSPEVLAHLGTAEARAMIEQFRAKGDVT